MKALADILLPEDLKYTDEHVWVALKDNEYILGISDFAQDQLGEIVFVDLPAEGASFKATEGFGTVESIKSVNTLFMPVDASIAAVNPDLDSTPTLVNENCYRNWMVKITPANAADLDKLLSAAAYRAVLA